jgi:hypothetical protein
MTLLFLGDVVGKPGRKAIADYLPALKEKEKIDFVICNAENAAAGFGINPKVAAELYAAGVDVITLGNHTWDQNDMEVMLAEDWRVLRPLNYPPNTAGQGWRVYPLPDGRQIGVVNLMGRLFMEPGLDCPFQASRKLMKDLRVGDGCDALVIDVHSEATSEKMCLAHVWDGKASLVVGSHTHTPTADERILDGGTGYHSDAGMCGHYNSSLGMAYAGALGRFEKKGKVRLEVSHGDGTMCGTLARLGDDGKCTHIRPIRIGGVLSQAL